MTEDEYWAEMVLIEMRLNLAINNAHNMHRCAIWALNHRFDGRSSYSVKERVAADSDDLEGVATDE